MAADVMAVLTGVVMARPTASPAQETNCVNMILTAKNLSTACQWTGHIAALSVALLVPQVSALRGVLLEV